MAAASDSLARPGEREMRFSRVFDAPRELVWEAWTHPEHVGQWWGPTGFTTTTQAIDVKPGGEWRFIMHGPDGTDYDNRIVFKEVVKPSRLAYVHGGASLAELGTFEVTVLFIVEGGKTRLDMTMVFQSVAARDEIIRKHGAFEGAKQHLERLRAYLVTRSQP